MKAVVIGPGRIGLGFAGDLLARAGFELAVVGRGAVIDNLCRTGRYRLRLAGPGCAEEREVRVSRAVFASDRAGVADQIADAEIVAVAVRPENLEAVAPLIASGLRPRRRDGPLNVIAFENVLDAGPRLRAAVVARLQAGVRPARHGFTGAVVHRVVTRRTGDTDGAEPLLFVGDREDRFEVHGPSLREPLRDIPGLTRVQDFESAFKAKLYVFCAAHATVAYLGFLKGYRYVHAAVRDPEIRAAALAAMREGQQGLAARYGRAAPGGELDAIISRFENAALNDPVARVGRDPRRKLSAGERLAGPASLCEAAGLRTATLPLAAAAAVCFAAAADPAADIAMADQLTAMQGDSRFAEIAATASRRFRACWREDAPLFSLSTPAP